VILSMQKTRQNAGRNRNRLLLLKPSFARSFRLSINQSRSLVWMCILACAVLVQPHIARAQTSPTEKPSTVQASRLRGVLPYQFDMHFLGLESANLVDLQTEAMIRLTMEIDGGTGAGLQSPVSMHVLTREGLARFLGGSNAADVAIATGTPNPLDPSNPRLYATFRALDSNGYTVIVQNRGTSLATYTLRVEGGFLLDQAGQTTVESSVVESLLLPDTGELQSNIAGKDPSRAVGQNVLGVGLSPAVSGRRLSGSLHPTNGRHYLTLEPSENAGQIVLTLILGPQNTTPSETVNFWVLSQDGMRGVVKGEPATMLKLATGVPIPYESGRHLYARFQTGGRGPYTVVIFNESEGETEYSVSAEGALLVDQYGQTNEAMAAVAEVAALAKSANPGLVFGTQSVKPVDSAAQGTVLYSTGDTLGIPQVTVHSTQP